MSIFLAAFPKGASLQLVKNYALEQLKMEDSDVMETFKSCPSVFTQCEDNSRKWKLKAFDSL